jgi:hypothetical protein
MYGMNCVPFLPSVRKFPEKKTPGSVSFTSWYHSHALNLLQSIHPELQCKERQKKEHMKAKQDEKGTRKR